jgi:PAS domain S-box-containing protein
MMSGDIQNELQQIAAEAVVEQFRAAEGPFVTASMNTRMPMIFTDAVGPNHRIIFANDSFLHLAGYERDSVLGKNVESLIGYDLDLIDRAKLDDAFQPDASTDLSFRFRRKDRSTFYASLFVSTVQASNGAVAQHFVSFHNTTSLVREKLHLQCLLDELNHRTQNTLVTVLAIAAQTLRRESDAKVYEKFEGRVLALSRVHTLLGQKNWSGADLFDVADQILRPFGLLDGQNSRFAMTGCEVTLPPKTALSLAMVFHELATNAVKHGALSASSEGHITLSWTLHLGLTENRLRLTWLESGGPLVTLEGRRGFGMRLIESGLAQELNGEVQFTFGTSGVRCEIDMRVPVAVGLDGFE